MFLHLWFYFCNALVILLISPFILITSSHPRWYPQFFRFERFWAQALLFLCGYWPVLDRPVPKLPGQRFILVSNHSSMLDILLMLALYPQPFLFIGKIELSRLPLFGYFYKRTNLLVDRASLSSRKAVYSAARDRLKKGQGLCIFPEGGAPEEDITLAPFKRGAFQLAAELQVPILPFTFLDCKKRFPFAFWRGRPGPLRVVVHEPLAPPELNSQAIEALKKRCYRIILQPLQMQTETYAIGSSSN